MCMCLFVSVCVPVCVCVCVCVCVPRVLLVPPLPPPPSHPFPHVAPSPHVMCTILWHPTCPVGKLSASGAPPPFSFVQALSLLPHVWSAPPVFCLLYTPPPFTQALACTLGHNNASVSPIHSSSFRIAPPPPCPPLFTRSAPCTSMPLSWQCTPLGRASEPQPVVCDPVRTGVR